MSRPIFTPEELAELAAADAEIDREDAPLTIEEWKASMRRDRGLPEEPRPMSQTQREASREYVRKYRAKNAEKSREAHRKWYARNAEYARAWQRAYYWKDPERHKAANRRSQLKCLEDPARFRFLQLRKALGLTQRQVGQIFGRTDATISFWETGKSRIPAAALAKLEALTAAADSYTE